MGVGGLALACVIAAFVGYVRRAPLDVARWHQPVAATADADLTGGAIRLLAGDEALMQRIDAAFRDLPRTDVLAGSVAQGRITYVTRTAFFGFPDLTTVELAGDQIRMFARLKFGASDLGVNRKRLEGVIAVVQ